MAVSAVLAAGVLLGSTGCAFFAPVATQMEYDPSDGVGVTVGDVDVRNAIAFTSDGDTVNLVMVVINTGDAPQAVQFQYDFEGTSDEGKSSETVKLAAGETISYGNGDEAPDLILDNANTSLGGLMPVYVQYGKKAGKTMMVPVLNGTLPGYSDLVPTAVPSATPEITATPIPTGVATTAPTESATPTPTPTASTN